LDIHSGLRLHIPAPLHLLRQAERKVHTSRLRIDWKFLNVRSWPIFGLTGKAYLYSITSSARVSNRGGIVSPSAWAVFKLMASWNFVGC
jgi:hypothetical protein